MTEYRNYDNNDVVEKTYKNMLEKQTLSYIEEINDILKYYNAKKYNIWYIIECLEDIVDESDPDTSLPQIHHAYQTAIMLKNLYISYDYSLKYINIRSLFDNIEWNNLPSKYKLDYSTSLNKFYKNIHCWDWLILVGFIHDLGKIMLHKSFGNFPQWAVVGDTFPLGNKLDPNYVYYEKNYHKNNSDLNLNIYIDNCGFNNVVFNWGHDEYLARLLTKFSNLPKEAIYIIRYHSFYSWHTPKNKKRGYINLASEYDWYMLPILKAFQKADLYSKNDNIPDFFGIKHIFSKLVEKYFPNEDFYLYY